VGVGVVQPPRDLHGPGEGVQRARLIVARLVGLPQLAQAGRQVVLDAGTGFGISVH